MLKANEAREIANSYNSHAAERTCEYIENLIKERAENGYFWATYCYEIDMEYYNVTQQDVNDISENLQRAGYSVKNSWFGGNLTIRW